MSEQKPLPSLNPLGLADDPIGRETTHPRAMQDAEDESRRAAWRPLDMLFAIMLDGRHCEQDEQTFGAALGADRAGFFGLAVRSQQEYPAVPAARFGAGRRGDYPRWILKRECPDCGRIVPWFWSASGTEKILTHTCSRDGS